MDMLPPFTGFVGGYGPNQPLADAALAWMQQKSKLEGKGLIFNETQTVDDDLLKKAQPTDSFKDFLGGVYRMIKGRHYRSMGATKFGNEFCSITSTKINGYAPKNLGYQEMKAVIALEIQSAS